jgi:thiamine pyrophosphate-dependent acetolactate synthase large subunit-like protein
MSARRASDVFVECLEAEGVRYGFGIPGEETLDLSRSLDHSSITFVPMRHEQGGAYMASPGWPSRYRAIVAKLVAPQRRVVAVSGDGGFLMNAQELETAMRLRTAVVNVVWEDGGFGSIAWKQRQRCGAAFGTSFTNPDFVQLAQSVGETTASAPG